MFKKRISISVILFSVFLMVVLGSIFVNHEIDIYQSKKEQANDIVQGIEQKWQVYQGMVSISYLRQKSPISVKQLVKRIVQNLSFKSHNVMYFPTLKEYEIWYYEDVYGLDPDIEFRHATMIEAINYYEEMMIGLGRVFPEFWLLNYLMKFLFVLGISSIPSLLAFLSSLLAISFPVAVPITALVLLFFASIQGYGDDGAIVKLMTNTTGGENSLTLGMLYLGEKSGGLMIVPQKGIWGAYGPVWKFSKGMVFFPVGIVCGKGENGFRVEHLSFWSISSINIGKFNHLLMGSYNHPLVKDRSPFASFKQTLYYTASRVKLGIRIDYSFQKIKKWKTKISIGPTLQLVKDKFIFHVHASITRPYTIKTEWQLSF